MKESGDRYYHDQVDPITADKRNQVIPRSALRKMVIACDTALNEEPRRVPGDMIFFDNLSTASGALIRLNNTSEDQWPIVSNGGVSDIPVRDVFITCTAQPGKILNLWYGTRARFIAPTSLSDISDRAGRLLGIVYGNQGQLAQAAIGGVNALVTTARGFTYGASFRSSAALAANTAETVFSAASNVNGAILWRATQYHENATATPLVALVAHTAAPANLATGTHIMIQDGANNSTNHRRYSKLEAPVFIPAGSGLYFIVDTAEGGAPQRQALYTLL